MEVDGWCIISNTSGLAKQDTLVPFWLHQAGNLLGTKALPWTSLRSRIRAALNWCLQTHDFINSHASGQPRI
eukprot:1160968-Pelagomonas_calceolata.AAC.9